VHSGLGHTYKSLTCGYVFLLWSRSAKPQVTDMGVQVPLGHQPFAHAAMTPVPRLTPIEARLTPNIRS